ncbi:MAG TPA: hypothetical protein DCG85_08790 [Lachnospiraceae bacterium]|nr:hypothetical protein [Lachnospiraceae bacterium]
MKKNLLRSLALMASVIVLSGCGNTQPADEGTRIKDIEAEKSVVSENSDEDSVVDLTILEGSYEDEGGANEQGYQGAYISDGRIEIYWILNNGADVTLYWAGDIDPSSVKKEDKGFSFISHNDKSRTGMAYLASSLEEKEFHVDTDGKKVISYEIVELGEPAMMNIIPTGTDYSKMGVSAEMAEMDNLSDVELEESGYRVYQSDDGIYVYYAVRLKNPNKDHAILYPRISIVATDKDGNIVKTEEVVLMGIAAEDTIYYGSSFVYDGEIADKVAFAAGNGRYSFEKQADSTLISTRDLKIREAKEESEDFSRKFTGTIKNDSEKNCKKVLLTVIYKSKGEIVGGEISLLENLNRGTEKKFEIYALPGFKEYDSFEIVALPWE